jgi:alkaline phosphatase D
MASSDIKKVAILDYLKPGWLEYAASNSCDEYPCTPDNQDSISKALSKVPHIRYWKTDELPETSL